jgi:hypothetical protein
VDEYTDIGVILGTSAGIIGLALILATFVQNKRSADAAHDANRPWIELQIGQKFSFDVNNNGVSFSVNVHVSNRGNSPATNVMIATSLTAQERTADGMDGRHAVRPLDKIFENWRIHERTIGRTIFPHQTPSDPETHGST